MLRANMNEVDVQPVDLGDELRQGVQSRLARAPVVLRRPIAREFLNHCERHALRLIPDGLFLGPVRGRDASAEVCQSLIGMSTWNGRISVGGLDGATHDDLRSSVQSDQPPSGRCFWCQMALTPPPFRPVATTSSPPSWFNAKAMPVNSDMNRSPPVRDFPSWQALGSLAQQSPRSWRWDEDHVEME